MIVNKWVKSITDKIPSNNHVNYKGQHQTVNYNIDSLNVWVSYGLYAIHLQVNQPQGKMFSWIIMFYTINGHKLILMVQICSADVLVLKFVLLFDEEQILLMYILNQFSPEKLNRADKLWVI